MGFVHLAIGHRLRMLDIQMFDIPIGTGKRP